VINSEIEGKIKRTLADNVIRDVNENSTKSEASVNVTNIIDSLPTDRVNESNNNNDEKFHAIVPESCQISCMT